MQPITETPEFPVRMTPIVEEPTSAEYIRCSSPRLPAGETHLASRRIYIQSPVEGQLLSHPLPVHYSSDRMAEIIAQLEELEDLERDLWEERHPGTDIDSDRLLKEVEDEVEATSNLTSRVSRYFLVKVHNCREAAREYLALAHETSPVGSLADEGLSKNIDDSIGTETEEHLDPSLQDHSQDVHLTKETSTYESSDTDLTLQRPILSADFGIAVHGINDLPAVYQREHLHNDGTEP